MAPGELEAVSPGDAELSVTYRQTTVTALIRVYPGEPPLWVLRPHEDPFDKSFVWARVLDASGPVGAGVGPGVLVEIIAGHNAGRSTVTDDQSRYEFELPWVCGVNTFRATKIGWQELVETHTTCGSLDVPHLRLTRAP